MNARTILAVFGLASVLALAIISTKMRWQVADSPPPGTYPSSNSSGWISADQLLELSFAVSKVENLPTGDYDCYSESDDDGETPTFKSQKERVAYERAKKKEDEAAARYVQECEVTREKEKAAYGHARGNLNKTWLPVLTKAVQLGDPVAEVILRLCGTASAINRTGIASDCSELEADRQKARNRLESINFRPALFNYAQMSHSEGRQRLCKGDYDSRTRCTIEEDIDRYKRILAVMSTGYLSVAESWNTCQTRSKIEEIDRLAEECQRLLYLTQSIAMLAPRSYSPQFSLTQFYHSPIDRLPPGTRVDWSPFRDPDFSNKLELSTKKHIAEIEANINRDLEREPRWSFFLGERPSDFVERAMNADAVR